MKKFIIPVIAIAAISLASCKKERTCTCTITPDGGSSYTTTEMVGHATKKTGKRLTGCYSRVYENTISGTTYKTTYDCKIK